MDNSLLPFFQPKGEIVIGASTSPEKLGYGVARNLIQSGYTGALHFVAQKSGELFGRKIHADLQERLIYPAIRAEVDKAEMMNQAGEEHHLVHVLIAELKKLKPADEKFQAKFSVLSELVKHHIEEEEGEMFPKAEECDIGWESLEATVLKRKETLLAKASGRKAGARPSRKTTR